MLLVVFLHVFTMFLTNSNDPPRGNSIKVATLIDFSCIGDNLFFKNIVKTHQTATGLKEMQGVFGNHTKAKPEGGFIISKP